MRLTLTFFLLQVTIWSATVTVCDTGCTYTTANLQTAINARACGDHVQLKAQSSVYPPFYLPGGTTLQCGTNPIYIENFSMSSLPPTGVLITPSYVPLLPNVQTSSNWALATHNGGVDCGGGSNHCPANGWVIQGLRFSENTGRAQSPCFILLGQVNTGCVLDPAIVLEADMPINITFQSNYVQTDPHTVTRRCMDLNLVVGTVRDNWIDCISPTLLDGSVGDSQVLAGDPVGTQASHTLVANNMLIGGTETIAWGAYPSAVHTPSAATNGAFGWLDQTTETANWVDVIGNHIQHDTYQLTANWTATTWFRVGQAVVNSGGSVPIFIALTSGQTGGAEPNWAGTAVGSTLTDGGITWLHASNQWNNGTCAYSVKNHFETKSMVNGRVLNNFLDRLWSQCASFGAQGRSLYPGVQTSQNGGGAASNIQNVDLANNIGTNLSGAFSSLTSVSFDDTNRWPRFFGSVIEPYNITSGNNTLKVSVDSQASSTITLTTGAARSALQVAADINAAAITNVKAAVWNIVGNNSSSCTTSSTVCQVLIMRAGSVNNNASQFNSDPGPPNPWNTVTNTAVSIGPATGTTATSALGLPANGTNVYWCSNPVSWVCYGCGLGSNIALRNNIFQMRHDGLYAPFTPTIGAINNGVDGFTVDHNLFNDPSGWGSIAFLINTTYLFDVNGVGRLGAKRVLIQNNSMLDTGHYVGDTSAPAGNHEDWSAINYDCQTQTLNAAFTQGGDQAAQCDAGHLKGGFTKNLAYGLPYSNGNCSPGLTCNTNPADNGLGDGAQPNDNPNADHFSSLSFLQASPGNNVPPDYTLVSNPSNPQKYMRPANFGTDNRPIGPDMTQMNFVRLAGNAPAVSDRAAIFAFNITPPLMAGAGTVTVATDPFCLSPVADMDPAQFANPSWTDNDRFPQFAAQRTVVAGLNTPLSPGTTYYYCIEYQGYGLRGSFTTGTALSGSRTVQVRTALTSLTQGASGANNMIVEYGTAYSRATDLLSGGGTTAPVPCTVGGGACSASFPATAGTPVYYRYKIRDASGTVLVTQPVSVQLALQE